MEDYEKPSELIVAYTAGLLDGEGCISWHHQQAGIHRKYPTTRCSVSIYQGETNRGNELGEWLAKQWGMGSVYKFSRNRTNPVYCWRVLRVNSVRFLLRACLPYMRVKRPAAQDALDNLDRLIGGRKVGIWTDGEVETLKQYWQHEYDWQLMERLPGRTEEGVLRQRLRLGLRKLKSKNSPGA